MNEKIFTIRMAAIAGKPIGFCYEKNWGKAYGLRFVSERRQIIPDPDEPIRTNARGEQYVIGEDLARGEPRSFTLDKITEVSVA